MGGWKDVKGEYKNCSCTVVSEPDPHIWIVCGGVVSEPDPHIWIVCGGVVADCCSHCSHHFTHFFADWHGSVSLQKRILSPGRSWRRRRVQASKEN